jgi:hypothetical protein
MSERFVIRDDRGGIWFAARMSDGSRRLMHAPQGKRFWHDGEDGFVEADVEGVTVEIGAAGRFPEAFVALDDIRVPPPEPQEDPKLVRIIDRILDGTPWGRSGAGVLSTSETIAVALATERHEHLPDGWSDLSEAWKRLDDAQREIVRRYVDGADYMDGRQPKF